MNGSLLPGVTQKYLSMDLPPAGTAIARKIKNAAGARDFKLYLPKACAKDIPLVVMLHGSTQSPEDFATGTRMNSLADEHGFLVAYPRQTWTANSSRAWNWFNTSDQQRDRGEPSLIADMTRQIIHDFFVDPLRVYVVGFSAGGAAAAVMGSVYPDLYAGVGVHSGLACGAARNMWSALRAMRNGGEHQKKSMPGQRNLPTIVFHGDADDIVNPINGASIIAYLEAEAQLTKTVCHDAREAGKIAFTRTVQMDLNGRIRLEEWVLHGAGHTWSGGSRAGSYTDERGPDASREMIRFFLQPAHPAALVRGGKTPSMPAAPSASEAYSGINTVPTRTTVEAQTA